MRKLYRDLGLVALRARQYAVAPYSDFKVGAALLTTSGKVYTGCNIESSSFSMTLCAERVAIFKAISEGERNFRAIAVATDTAIPTPPCGACRQVLSDLAGNIDIITINTKKRHSIHPLKSLLPHAFTASFLRSRSKKRAR